MFNVADKTAFCILSKTLVVFRPTMHTNLNHFRPPAEHIHDDIILFKLSTRYYCNPEDLTELWSKTCKFNNKNNNNNNDNDNDNDNGNDDDNGNGNDNGRDNDNDSDSDSDSDSTNF